MQEAAICIRVSDDANPVTTKAADILARGIEERSGAHIQADNKDCFQISLSIDHSIGTESYGISDTPDGGVGITGGDGLGLLYGVGKFLRSSEYGGGFVPGRWRGRSAPECPVRGMYFAVHFNNFYEAAPVAEVERYLEDLTLWGLNAIAFHFPPQQFDGFDDPNARRSIDRIRTLMLAAKRIGLKVGLLEAVNIGFKSTPERLYYTPFPDNLGRRGHLGTLLCPSSPDGREYLLRQWSGLIDEFNDIDLDFFVSWPYDEGGCGCGKCWPWGREGYLRISEDISEIFRGKYPASKFVLSTWMYDTPPTGEWDGLSRYMAENGPWIDYIMADAHEDFPRYPLDNPVPGNRSLINFQEISMWGQGPWGGYGANPLLNRFQRLWNQASYKLSGGFPYSEGIFEDINKVLCLQFYWEKNRPAEDIFREYAAAEFSPDAADDVLEAARILEENHSRENIGESAARAWELMEKSDKALTPWARKNWRWRILYLRALIDYNMYMNNGELRGAALADAFDELTEIYYAQNAYESVRPPRIF